MSENANEEIVPIILSGGSGTRLWPLSRACFPKQYLNLLNDKNNSLLQNTILRLKGINGLQDPLIICNEEQRFIVAEQMRELDVKPQSILLEPIGKSTAPAIALAALKSLEYKKDPILLILSSDHKIEDPKAFQGTINQGIELEALWYLKGSLYTRFL